jgi:hypothetical protein
LKDISRNGAKIEEAAKEQLIILCVLLFTFALLREIL